MDSTANGNEPERPLTRRERRELERKRELEQAERLRQQADAQEVARVAEHEASARAGQDAAAEAAGVERPPATEVNVQSPGQESTAAPTPPEPLRSSAAAKSAPRSVEPVEDPFAAILEDEAPSSSPVTNGALLTEPPKRGRRWGCLVVVLVLVAAIVGGGVVVWNQFGDRISDFFSMTETDYEGPGNGVEVNFTILPGDTGTSIGQRLEEEGIVLTADAFVKAMLAMPEEPVLIPGTYLMQEEMSAAAAIVALTDQDNRIENTVTIPEGTIQRDVFTLVESATGIPVAELETAAADPQRFGLPAEAQSLEGFLFPATYNFSSEDTAESVLTKMVDRTYESLAAHGVPEDQVWEVIRLASLIEKEARFEEDFYKVSRVFLNRIDSNMLLQSDATVTYGTGAYDRASTSDTEREDAANEYNTYVHPGMIIRPISNPGDLAIDAAMHPADGPWLFFVTVNLETGETVFTETYEEHLAAVDEWLKWLEENPDYE